MSLRGKSLRTQPLKIVFAVSAVWMVAVFVSILATLAIGDAVFYAAGTAAAVGIAALLTVVAARQRRRERLGTLSEPLRYRLAIQSGEVSGDVSHWPAWIKRDRKRTMINVILYPMLPVFYGVLLLLTSIIGAAVHPWVLVPLSVTSGVVTWQQWRIRQRLAALGEKVAALTVTAQVHRA